MFKLDDNFLIELGLGSLPPAEKNKMLSHIYETLEMRVGMKLAEKMSSEQLDEFEAFINSNNEAGALQWLESNFPNYKQVVSEELEKLKLEIKNSAPQIVAQASAAQPPQAQVVSSQPLNGGAQPQQSFQQPNSHQQAPHHPTPQPQVQPAQQNVTAPVPAAPPVQNAPSPPPIQQTAHAPQPTSAQQPAQLTLNPQPASVTQPTLAQNPPSQTDQYAQSVTQTPHPQPQVTQHPTPQPQVQPAHQNAPAVTPVQNAPSPGAHASQQPSSVQPNQPILNPQPATQPASVPGNAPPAEPYQAPS